MQADEFMTGVLRTASGNWGEIAARTTPEGMLELLHSTLGIVSEIAELQDAADETNVIEELGDIMWFAALGYHSRGVMFELPTAGNIERMSKIISGDRWLSYMLDVMLVSAAELCSMVKARMFYGKTLDNSKALKHLGVIVGAVCAQCRYLGIEVGTVLELNQKKLRARFPEKFTETCALVSDLDAEPAVLENGNG